MEEVKTGGGLASGPRVYRVPCRVLATHIVRYKYIVA
jgi:hypothetical protein